MFSCMYYLLQQIWRNSRMHRRSVFFYFKLFTKRNFPNLYASITQIDCFQFSNKRDKSCFAFYGDGYVLLYKRKKMKFLTSCFMGSNQMKKSYGMPKFHLVIEEYIPGKEAVYKSIILYERKTWPLNKSLENRLLALEWISTGKTIKWSIMRIDLDMIDEIQRRPW